MSDGSGGQSSSGASRRALEISINWLLRCHAPASAALEALEGQRFLFSSTEPTVQLVCRIAGGQLCLLPVTPTTAQNYCAELSGHASAWLELWTATDWRVALAGGVLELRGDVAAAQDLAGLLHGLREVDWERPLATVCGDVVAHRARQGVHWLARAQGEVTRSLWSQLHEFLVDEAGTVPPLDRAAVNFRGALARRVRHLADVIAAR